ncbi:MAG: pyridoxamine 5'-phosphate oxidase family protein [Pseudomonadales bacterium]
MSFYSKAQRQCQDQFDSRPMADAMESAIITDTLSEPQQAFISTRDFFFLSTVNAAGEPTVSHKGGAVGTVKVLDDRTLAFPAYDGNGMFLSMGNIQDTARIGLLFMDFETPNRLRVQATASIAAEDALLAQYPGALAVVRARVDAVFVNCARYIHKYQRVESSPYVPDATGAAPQPQWKRIDAMQPVLSQADRDRTTAAGGTISEQEYGAALLRGES